jgi:PAS domain S-box-containing protein
MKGDGASASLVAGLSQAPIQQYLIYDALDRGPALIFIADDDMRYLAVNETACDALGYTREEILGLRVTDVAVAPEADETYQQMKAARWHLGVTPIRAKDGTVFQFSYRAEEIKVAGMPYYVSIGFITS